MIKIYQDLLLKWIEAYDESGKDYRVNEEIRIKTPMLRSDLCDFSDLYIVVKGYIAVTNPDDAKRNKSFAFKNNAPLPMPMYNLLEYSKNYRKTTGCLWNYYQDKPSNPLSSNCESFKYQTSITGNTYNLIDSDASNDATKVGKNETEIFVPLKHLSNSWKTLNISSIIVK